MLVFSASLIHFARNTLCCVLKMISEKTQNVWSPERSQINVTQGNLSTRGESVNQSNGQQSKICKCLMENMKQSLKKEFNVKR